MEALIILAVILSVYCIYIFTKKPQSAVFVILTVVLINEWFIKQPLSVNIGINFYFTDGLAILLFISSLFRMFFLGEFRNNSIVWILFGILLFISLYTGWKINGSAAGVEFRGYFSYWACTLYFINFEYSKTTLEKILKVWYIVNWFLLALFCFRLAAELMHLSITAQWHDPTPGTKYRVINSATTNLFGVLLLWFFVRNLVPEAVKPSKTLTVVYLVIILILQHRSDWLAVIAGIASASLLPGIKVTRMFKNFIVIGMVGFILLLPAVFLGYADSFLDSINAQAERATQFNQGTVGDRLKGWTSFLELWQRLPLLYEIFGEPMAGSPGGLKHGLHNFYLQVIARTGVLGILLVTFFYLSILAKLYLNVRRFPEDKVYYAFFFMAVVFQMVYLLPYYQETNHAIILGIATSLVKRRISSKELGANTKDNSQYFLKPPTKKQVEQPVLAVS